MDTFVLLEESGHIAATRIHDFDGARPVPDTWDDAAQQRILCDEIRVSRQQGSFEDE